MAATANTIGGTPTTTTAPLPVANSIDPINDLIPIYTASVQATQAISQQTYLGITGNPVGTNDSQTLTNKTLGNTNTITVKDGNFTLQNTSDTTKQARFSLASLTTGNTRTFTLPDLSDTIVTLTATQTLTNKTLTSPAINSPSISNATITSDSYAGYTVSTSGSIYGISVTSGVISTTGSVGIGANVTNGVQAAQLATNALTLGSASITTNFTTTSATAVQVTGLAITVTIPAGGRSIRISALASDMFASASATFVISLWDGTVGSGAQLARCLANNGGTTGVTFPSYVSAIVNPSAGSKTYNVGFQTSGGTGTIEAASTYPAYILVEAI